MMASEETTETYSWYAIVRTNIVVFLTAILWSLIFYSYVYNILDSHANICEDYSLLQYHGV